MDLFSDLNRRQHEVTDRKEDARVNSDSNSDKSNRFSILRFISCLRNFWSCQIYLKLCITVVLRRRLILSFTAYP